MESASVFEVRIDPGGRVMDETFREMFRCPEGFLHAKQQHARTNRDLSRWSR